MDRTLLKISGADAGKFLQDLVTNDIMRKGLVYTALLSPKGKYLFDFFIFQKGDFWIIDAQADQSQALAQRLSLYRLRADVVIELSDLTVSRGITAKPTGALDDPRHPALGWRYYSIDPLGANGEKYKEIRVMHCIPEAGIELISDETYILEAGFERLNGVDFKKGCYVGQEVTARMKHKTELRKGFVTVAVNGSAEVGTQITNNGKPCGTLYSQANGQAIAYLRFDRASGEMTAGSATVTLI